MRLTRNQVYSQGYRGFESLPLRQISLRQTSRTWRADAPTDDACRERPPDLPGRRGLRAGCEPLHSSRSSSAARGCGAARIGTFFAGQLAPQGKSGKKFRLLLDDTSSVSLAAKVAARGAAASGLAAGTQLENSSTGKLRVHDDGSVSLRIKSEALTSGMGAVVFKAKLAGAALGTE